jgi:hypothetical protein
MQAAPSVTLHRSANRAIVTRAVPQIREQFPFTISLAQDEARLQKAVAIRAAAYGRHIPELAVKFADIDTLDRSPGVTVLVAESKQDGAPLGSIRIQTNQHHPLLIEQAVDVPKEQGQVLAELTRLSVCQESIGRIVKLALFRATFQYCVQYGIDRLVIGAREPLDRQYRGLLFEELFAGQGAIPLAYANNIPHHILYLDIASAPRRWEEANHPMHGFLTAAAHPDIDLSRAKIVDEVLH